MCMLKISRLTDGFSHFIYYSELSEKANLVIALNEIAGSREYSRHI